MAARPDGGVKESDFRFETSSLPEPGENEMLLETQYLSLDPYMRARMDAVKSYAAYLEIGDVMIGHGIARVAVSRHPQFQAGRHRPRPDWVAHALFVERRERAQAGSRTGPPDFVARDPGDRGISRRMSECAK